MEEKSWRGAGEKRLTKRKLIWGGMSTEKGERGWLSGDGSLIDVENGKGAR